MAKNNIIPEKAIKDILAAAEAIRELDEKTLAYEKRIDSLIKTMSKSKISYDDLKKTQKKSKDETKNLINEEKKLIQIEKDLKKTTLELEKGRKKVIETLTKQAIKEQQLIKDSKLEIRTVDDLKMKIKALTTIRDRINRTTAEGRKRYKELTVEIRKYRGELKKTRTTSSGLIGVFKGQIKAIATMAAGYLGITSVLRLFSNASQKIVGFEKALSSLSAITGLVGNDLDKMAAKALEFSKETNVGAQGIIEAFERVGSIRPELLKDSEALAEVTKQAIILSEATGGKLSLEDAAIAVAGSLNQYSLASDKANVAANALAAGSKVGAAGVVQQTAAIKKFGAVADSGNVTLEQSIGLIQTLAEKQILGEEAGTNLRNITIKLQGDQENYKDGIFDVNLALDNLAKRNLSVTELTKKFGLQSVVSAQILIKGRQKVIDYTEAVTGTNIALEQQAIQNANIAGSSKKFGNAFAALAIRITRNNTVISKMTKGVIDWGTAMFNSISPIQSSARAIEEEQTQVLGLVSQLTDANTTESERLRILRELHTISPDIVEDLDAENISVDTLRQNLDKYNSSIAKRILLANLDKDDQKKAIVLAKKMAERGKAEIEINKFLAKSDLEIATSKGTLAEKTQLLIDKLIAEGAIMDEVLKKSDISINRSGVRIDNRSKEQKQLDEIIVRTSRLNKLINEENELKLEEIDLSEQQKELLKVLGIETEVTGKKKKKASEDEKESDEDRIKRIREELKQRQIWLRIMDETIKTNDDFTDSLLAEDIQEDFDLLTEAIKKGEDAVNEFYENWQIKRQINAIEEDQAAQHRLDIMDLTNEAGLALIDAFFSSKAMKRDEELNEIQVKNDIELDKLNALMESGSISAEEFSKRKIALDEEMAAAELRIRIDQAKAEKKQALFQIAIDTTLAIFKIKAQAAVLAAIPIFGGALAAKALAQIPIVLAGAAISSGAIITRKLPSFKKGTKLAPKGPLEIAEEGRELAHKKTGQLMMFSKKTITDELEGATIYTNKETEAIMAGRAGFDSPEIKAMTDSNERVARALENQPIYYFETSKRQITERRGNYERTYINRKVKGLDR